MSLKKMSLLQSVCFLLLRAYFVPLTKHTRHCSSLVIYYLSFKVTPSIVLSIYFVDNFLLPFFSKNCYLYRTSLSKSAINLSTPHPLSASQYLLRLVLAGPLLFFAPIIPLKFVLSISASTWSCNFISTDHWCETNVCSTFNLLIFYILSCLYSLHKNRRYIMQTTNQSICCMYWNLLTVMPIVFCLSFKANGFDKISYTCNLEFPDTYFRPVYYILFSL